MPQVERERYTQAIRDLQSATSPLSHSLKLRYKDLLANHKNWFSQGIHWNEANFLPWHRWFLLKFENLLMEIDECITVPFWSWDTEGANPWLSDLWGPTSDWFGAGENQNCVPDGPFTSPFTISDNTCLRRQRQGGVDDSVDIYKFILSKKVAASTIFPTVSEWNSFSMALELVHSSVHCTIGGTMCSLHAADAPEFMLHHANIDRIWNKWQKKGYYYLHAQMSDPNYNVPMFLGNNPSNHAAEGATPSNMADLSNHLGVCAEYGSTLNFPGWLVDNIFLDPYFKNLSFDWMKVRHVYPTDPFPAIVFMRKVAKRDIIEALRLMDKEHSGRSEYLDYERMSYGREPEYDDLPLFTRLVGVDMEGIVSQLSGDLADRFVQGWEKYKNAYQNNTYELDKEDICVELDLMDPGATPLDRSNRCKPGLVCDVVGIRKADSKLIGKCRKETADEPDEQTFESSEIQRLVGKLHDRCNCLDGFDSSCDDLIERIMKVFNECKPLFSSSYKPGHEAFSEQHRLCYEKAWKNLVRVCKNLECVPGDLNSDGKKNILDIIALVQDVLDDDRARV